MESLKSISERWSYKLALVLCTALATQSAHAFLIDDSVPYSASGTPMVAPLCKLGKSGTVTAPIGNQDARDPLAAVSKDPKEMLSRFYSSNDLVDVPQEDSSPELVQLWLMSPTPDYHEKLRGPAAKAAIAMIDYARAMGIDLYIHSGLRDYSTQCLVFNTKMRKEYALDPRLVEGRPADERVAARNVNTRSALPGQSEHQLGTAVDFVTFLDVMDPLKRGYKLEHEMDQTPAFAWLQANAYRFGFVLTYPKGPNGPNSVNARTGYVYEPWHWRYIGVRTATTYQACAAVGWTTQDFLREIAKNPSFQCASVAGQNLYYNRSIKNGPPVGQPVTANNQPVR